ncbi:MAG TPA: 2Fe-2S iron-sulfur cluster binding domain-containing protein [Chlorobaculum parvum]|uniref:2Fe-2S iron-sulfur cluster binding domain-containing protein n=1 Tax=Chlorobaculum parvum TaxID=274539 RepID=A0A7C5HKD4_9CHLB|nr:2Fe-2S iron-sulfur cluster binding domain-containing protein [Chlorobaculum parvum]
MNIYINDKPCKAEVGDLLLNAAKNNKAHIGYICGGNAICQSCFVYVLEGADCLSKPGEDEKAFISDKLFDEGGRLACRTTIAKEGTIHVLTRAEKLRRTVLGLNVPEFITYAQTIGYNVTNKLPSGVSNIVSRVQSGRLNPADSLKKIAAGLGPASLLVASNFIETFPFMQMPLDMAGNAAKGALDAAGSVARDALDTASGALCTISDGRVHLPGSNCPAHGPQEAIERVTIKSK